MVYRHWCSQIKMQRLHIGTSIGNYLIIEELGMGAFASVYKAEDKVSHCLVALKAISRSKISSPRDLQIIYHEVEFMKSIDHPFIAAFYELIENKDFICIVMELMENGTLLDMVNRENGLHEMIARRYFIQIMIAVEYLHDVKHIVHRDLKAENIMIDRNCNIKLIDFGLSHEYSPESPYLSTSCGSPAYVAPEIVLKKPYTSKSDMWSLGVILYAMSFGSLPFFDTNLNKLLKMIILANVKFPQNVNRDLADLIDGLMDKSPNSRFSIQDVKTHPWLTQSTDITIFGRVERALNSLSLTPNNECDEKVIQRMQLLGVEIDDLISDLEKDESNERTVLYRIIKRFVANDAVTKQFGNFSFDVEDIPNMKLANSRMNVGTMIVKAADSGKKYVKIPRKSTGPNIRPKYPTFQPMLKQQIQIPVRTRVISKFNVI